MINPLKKLFKKNFKIKETAISFKIRGDYSEVDQLLDNFYTDHQLLGVDLSEFEFVKHFETEDGFVMSFKSK